MAIQHSQHLTTRQREIVRAVLEGASNKEVAVRLNISEQTVKNQLTTVYEKLGIGSRVQLAVMVREQPFHVEGPRRFDPAVEARPTA
jgi:DNA-binding NarL/FixJ family response regulator